MKKVVPQRMLQQSEKRSLELMSTITHSKTATLSVSQLSARLKRANQTLKQFDTKADLYPAYPRIDMRQTLQKIATEKQVIKATRGFTKLSGQGWRQFQQISTPDQCRSYLLKWKESAVGQSIKKSMQSDLSRNTFRNKILNNIRGIVDADDADDADDDLSFNVQRESDGTGSENTMNVSQHNQSNRFQRWNEQLTVYVKYSLQDQNNFQFNLPRHQDAQQWLSLLQLQSTNANKIPGMTIELSLKWLTTWFAYKVKGRERDLARSEYNQDPWAYGYVLFRSNQPDKLTRLIENKQLPVPQQLIKLPLIDDISRYLRGDAVHTLYPQCQSPYLTQILLVLSNKALLASQELIQHIEWLDLPWLILNVIPTQSQKYRAMVNKVIQRYQATLKSASSHKNRQKMSYEMVIGLLSLQAYSGLMHLFQTYSCSSSYFTEIDYIHLLLHLYLHPNLIPTGHVFDSYVRQSARYAAELRSMNKEWEGYWWIVIHQEYLHIQQDKQSTQNLQFALREYGNAFFQNAEQARSYDWESFNARFPFKLHDRSLKEYLLEPLLNLMTANQEFSILEALKVAEILTDSRKSYIQCLLKIALAEQNQNINDSTSNSNGFSSSFNSKTKSRFDFKDIFQNQSENTQQIWQKKQKRQKQIQKLNKKIETLFKQELSKKGQAEQNLNLLVFRFYQQVRQLSSLMDPIALNALQAFSPSFEYLSPTNSFAQQKAIDTLIPHLQSIQELKLYIRYLRLIIKREQIIRHRKGESKEWIQRKKLMIIRLNKLAFEYSAISRLEQFSRLKELVA